ncbi:MAG TPA: ADP-ribosylglycohydrolase family protein, partial [Bacteroidales bacterium]|nr:ADP-ribosylglycohydrolase family protein [Bacteroidales bacterium]
ITSQYGYDLSQTCNEIRKVNHFNETCQVTVPQAIIAFLESKDFETAVRLAVSIGGDSDTIAAIAGGLSEAFYKEIPGNLIYIAMDRLPVDIMAVVKAFYKKISEKDPETFGKIYNHIVTGS